MTSCWDVKHQQILEAAYKRGHAAVCNGAAVTTLELAAWGIGRIYDDWDNNGLENMSNPLGFGALPSKKCSQYLVFIEMALDDHHAFNKFHGSLMRSLRKLYEDDYDAAKDQGLAQRINAVMDAIGDRLAAAQVRSA